jgi:hypothetical protein
MTADRQKIWGKKWILVWASGITNRLVIFCPRFSAFLFVHNRQSKKFEQESRRAGGENRFRAQVSVSSVIFCSIDLVAAEGRAGFFASSAIFLSLVRAAWRRLSWLFRVPVVPGAVVPAA